MATTKKAPAVETIPLLPLLVTTEHKGVFFGYGQKKDGKEITIAQARMAVHWCTEVHGVLGLASKGPSKSCKIGPAVPSLTLQGVTAIAECTPEAAQAWESEPWR